MTMGMGTMGVRVEVWPVAADPAGLWLLSGGDALRCDGVLDSDDDVFDVAAWLLWRHDLQPKVLHSTSWRQDGATLIATFVAAVDADGFALDRDPRVAPIAVPLADAVGRPLPHAADEPPTPRDVDVLFHALRHLRFLLDTDDTTADALDGHWRAALAPLAATLAGMYRRVA